MASNAAEWFTWTTASGNLTVTLPNSVAIASLWFPSKPGAITVTPNVGSGYVTQTTGAEVVPLPAGTTSVVLAYTGSATVLVYATSTPLNPTVVPPASTPYNQVALGLPLCHFYPLSDPSGSSSIVDYAYGGASGAPGTSGDGYTLGAPSITVDGATCLACQPSAGLSSLGGTTGGSHGLCATSPWSIVVVFKVSGVLNPGGNIGCIFTNGTLHNSGFSWSPPPSIQSGIGEGVGAFLLSGGSPELLVLMGKTGSGGGQGLYTYLLFPGLTLNTSHMLYMAYDGTNLYGQLDLGTQQSVAVSSFDNTVGNFSLGWDANGEDYMVGYLSKFTVFTEVLTQAQIVQLYTGALG
jgi:hypothetical protein